MIEPTSIHFVGRGADLTSCHADPENREQQARLTDFSTRVTLIDRVTIEPCNQCIFRSTVRMIP